MSFLVDDNDKKQRTIKLTAKVEINEMELDFLISDSSAIGNAMPSEISEIAIYNRSRRKLKN